MHLTSVPFASAVVRKRHMRTGFDKNQSLKGTRNPGFVNCFLRMEIPNCEAKRQVWHLIATKPATRRATGRPDSAARCWRVEALPRKEEVHIMWTAKK